MTDGTKGKISIEGKAPRICIFVDDVEVRNSKDIPQERLELLEKGVALMLEQEQAQAKKS